MRTRWLTPTFPLSTVGGIDVWARVVRMQARAKYCYDLIDTVARVPGRAGEAQDFLDRAEAAATRAAAAGTPVVAVTIAEGDAGAERRLANLLYV